jgi:hypothetical protein
MCHRILQWRHHMYCVSLVKCIYFPRNLYYGAFGSYRRRFPYGDEIHVIHAAWWKLRLPITQKNVF